MHLNDSAGGNPITEINGLHFVYYGQMVLEAVNLEVYGGDFIAMIGPNGGGKATLLRLMLGLLKPSQGRIRVMGRPATRVSHHIGYVPQDVHINRRFPITALDVVLMGKLAPGKRWSKNTKQDRRDALESLERIDMADDANRRIGKLSGGQCQRAFIARALVTPPRPLLLEEPTASIDSNEQMECYQMLKRPNKEVTIIVVSHDLLVTIGLVDRISTGGRTFYYGMAPNAHHAPHPHFYCTGCGQMDCLTPESLNVDSDARWKTVPGCIDKDEVRVDGICKNCMK